MLELAATNTYTGPTNVNSGTLQIDAGASIKSTAITVGMGGSLQLAGTTNASAQRCEHHDARQRRRQRRSRHVGRRHDGIDRHDHRRLQHRHRCQQRSGHGLCRQHDRRRRHQHAASLTATQILQNTLTINASSTVTIAPSAGAGGGVVAAASTGRRLRRALPRRQQRRFRSDPFTAIQDAIAVGLDQQCQGPATRKPHRRDRTAGGNRSWPRREPVGKPSVGRVAFLVDLCLRPMPRRWRTAVPACSPPTASAFGTGSSGSGGAFAPAASFSGSPAAVPEPSTLLLAALGGIGLAFAARRRRTALKTR